MNSVSVEQVSVDAALLNFTADCEGHEVVGVCGNCQLAGSVGAVDV